MSLAMLRRINLICFRIALTTIGFGVLLCIFLIWGGFGLAVFAFGQLLLTDIVVLIGAILTNLAIKCYVGPAGLKDVTRRSSDETGLPTAEEYAADQS